MRTQMVSEFMCVADDMVSHSSQMTRCAGVKLNYCPLTLDILLICTYVPVVTSGIHYGEIENFECPGKSKMHQSVYINDLTDPKTKERTHSIFVLSH